MSGEIDAAPLADLIATGTEKIRQEFDAGGSGRAAIAARSSLIDSVVSRLYQQAIASDLLGPTDFALVALGGYGRRELFPHSDVDLLFLSRNGRVEESLKEKVTVVSRTLWDLGLRVGNTSRTLDECSRLHRNNLEFNISLLDCRYIAGDADLFADLHEKVIPHFVARDRQDLVQDLVEMTRQRHQKQGNTVFQLEPNLKDAQGGLRDYHVARWLALIRELERSGRWADPEALWPEAARGENIRAFGFLCSVRCFLHFRAKRDDNQLTYERQEAAASCGIGLNAPGRVTPAEWTRAYFRHARNIDRLTSDLVDESSTSRSSLYGLFKDWRSRVANADFSVMQEKAFFRQPAMLLQDPGLVLNLFETIARHGLEPSREAERQVEQSLPSIAGALLTLPNLGRRIGQILALPHAAPALRAMHRMGVLVTVVPEFRAIDTLVIRDFFHRYTVDEHTFMTIQHLHELRAARTSSGSSAANHGPGIWEAKLGEVLSEIEHPEILLLALLLHDVGKGMPYPSHLQGSLEAAKTVLTRLGLEPEPCETVCYLIAKHLEMSQVIQRRDIFDPETIRAFAEQVDTMERLKLLTLFTYADIKAVNPEALTPFKTEMLWRLYAATSNYLARSVDEERLQPAEERASKATEILRLLPGSASAAQLDAFLDGFPRRYLSMHSAEQIARHFLMARQLGERPVQLDLRAHEGLFELTILTGDRPFLFADITGTLAAWGMNILKADAFANRKGTILDTFRFVDLFRTLELNPTEVDRFKENLVKVLMGKTRLELLVGGRINSRVPSPPKVTIPLQIWFDDQSSSHSTLLELIAQDRPGLLYQVSSTLARHQCNIEVALIDTEGQKAIDVFYLTIAGSKLSATAQEAICNALTSTLQTSPILSPAM
jgi:[protein-PII] uridylyltransferase